MKDLTEYFQRDTMQSLSNANIYSIFGTRLHYSAQLLNAVLSVCLSHSIMSDANVVPGIDICFIPYNIPMFIVS